MVAHKLDPLKVATFALLVKNGMTKTNAAKEAKIGWATVMRQLKEPTSALTIALAEMGIFTGGIPSWENYKPLAQKALKDFGFFREYFFARSTSPWAQEAANKIVELLATPQEEYLVINVGPGAGKDVALDTPLLTPSGWTTMGEIEVGDFVFDDKGKPTKVVAKSEVFYDHECFEVRTDDGASVIAGAGHEWPVRLRGLNQSRNFSQPWYPGKTGTKPSGGIKLKTTKYLATRRSKRPQLAVAPALEFKGKVRLPINPYLLGVWLGDGHSASGRISQSNEDANWLIPEIEKLGYEVTNYPGRQSFGVKGLSKQLRSLGVFKNKHIPEIYFRSNRENRLALLQGLIDTDGSVDPEGSIEFCNTNPGLAIGVQLLARSLGVKASISESRAMLYGKDCGPRWRVSFYLKDAARLPRKAIRTRNGTRTPHRYLTVTPVETVPTQCIQVEADSHSYLVGLGLMLTHNSTLFTHDIPAWILARSRDKSIMIGSASQNLANGYVNRLRTTLERTKPEKADHKLVELGLAHDAKSTLPLSYGRFRPVGAGQWSRSQFDIEQIDGQSRNEKEASVAGFGMDAGYLGGRYDFIIWDDLVTNATLRTEVAREKLISDWENQAETRLEPEGLLVLQGQRLGPNDLYRYCLNLKGVQEIDASGYDDTEVKKYHHIVFKAHYEEKCEGEHARSAKPYPQGCLLDPRRLSWQKLRTIQINKEGTFRTVYQQEDIAAGNNLVQMAWIDGGADSSGAMMPGCWDEERSSGVVPQGVKGTSVVTADPSVSNYWGLIWWLYNPDTKFQHLIDIKREQMSASDFLDWDYTNNCFTGALETWWQESNQQGRPIAYLIMEENAAHKYLSQYNHFKRWQSLRRVTLKPHTTGRNKSDPKYGVQTIGPYYRHGMVRLPGNRYDGSRQLVKQLVKEVTEWPNGITDDLVMSHWFLVWNARSLVSSDNLDAPTEQVPSWIKEMGF
jgi:hypothetical protein